MGLFDSVLFRCPNCGSDIEVQSKAGSCTLEWFPVEQVPDRLAADIGGREVECDRCCRLWRVVPETEPKFVAMRLE